MRWGHPSKSNHFQSKRINRLINGLKKCFDEKGEYKQKKFDCSHDGQNLKSPSLYESWGSTLSLVKARANTREAISCEAATGYYWCPSQARQQSCVSYVGRCSGVSR
jgi:hypothetical protein